MIPYLSEKFLVGKLRPGILFFLFAFVLAPLSLQAESLERIEAIAARYPTLREFLADPEGVKEYGEAYKSYLRADKDFDEVFKTFVKQLTDAALHIPGFAEKAWHLDPDRNQQGFEIEATRSGSGVDLKRDTVFEVIENFESGLVKNAAPISPETASNLAKKLQAHLESLGSKKLSDLARYTNGGVRSALKPLPADAESIQFNEKPEAQKLANFLARQIFQHNEAFKDAVYSGDADILIGELTKLRDLSSWAPFYKARGIEVPPLVLQNLFFEPSELKSLFNEYQLAQKGIDDFRKIAEPRLEPDLLAHVMELRQRYGEEKVGSYIKGEEQRREYYQWKEKRDKVRNKKEETFKSHNKTNPYFEYYPVRDSTQNIYRLPTETGSSRYRLRLSPRAIHAFLAGYKNKECVGGRSCADLTPKRWARAALEGSKNYFLETGDGKMNGMVGLTRLARVSVSGAKALYDVVDLMSTKLRDLVVVRDSSGREIKFTLFDIIVDMLSRRKNAVPLIIANGSTVALNIGGNGFLHKSRSFMQSQTLGPSDDFSPADEMAEAISQRYPPSLQDIGKGKMIYTGMKGDASQMVELVPSHQRRKRSQQEIEEEIMDRLAVRDDSLDDQDIIWKEAQENGYRLGRAASYASKAQQLLATEDSQLKIFVRILARPGSFRAKQAALGDLQELLEGNKIEHLPDEIIVGVHSALASGDDGTIYRASFALEHSYYSNKQASIFPAPLTKTLIANFHKYRGTEVGWAAGIALKVSMGVHIDDREYFSTDFIDAVIDNLIPRTDGAGVAIEILKDLMKRWPDIAFTNGKIVDSLSQWPKLKEAALEKLFLPANDKILAKLLTQENVPRFIREEWEKREQIPAKIEKKCSRWWRKLRSLWRANPPR